MSTRPTGLLVLTQRAQHEGEIYRHSQHVRIVSVQLFAVKLVSPFEQWARSTGFAAGLDVVPRFAQQPGHLTDNLTEGAGGVNGSQDMRQQSAPGGPDRGVVPRVAANRRPQQSDDHRPGCLTGASRTGRG